MAVNGATVCVLARNQEKLASVVEAITSAGGKADAMPCDVSQPDAIEKVVETIVEKHGRLDILVNNAGVTRDTLLPRMSNDEWDEVLSTNLRAPFLFMCGKSSNDAATVRTDCEHLKRFRMIGNPGQANYSASKAGLIGLTQTVAKELAGRKVTVNAVAPGFIASDMTDALGFALLDVVKKRVPAKRLGLATEIAEAVAFLASPSAGYITAQTLVVDGGLIG